MSCNGTWTIEKAGGDLKLDEVLEIKGDSTSGIPKKGSGFWGSNYKDTNGEVTFNSKTHHVVIEGGKLNCYEGGGEGAVWTAHDG